MVESALHGLAQEQVDCGILQETKLTNIVYTRESNGFRVMATAAPSNHRSGVAIFYREAAAVIYGYATCPGYG